MENTEKKIRDIWDTARKSTVQVIGSTGKGGENGAEAILEAIMAELSQIDEKYQPTNTRSFMNLREVQRKTYLDPHKIAENQGLKSNLKSGHRKNTRYFQMNSVKMEG